MTRSSESVLILDYGVGNVGSVANMLKHLNVPCEISSDSSVLRHCRRIILPGVGAFDPGMMALRARALDIALRDAVSDGAYLLGICLGAQLLLEASDEGAHRGLGLVAGKVRRFQTGYFGLRVPHMGWNVVTPSLGAKLFDAPDFEQRFYFAHSYYLDCANANDVAATCRYGHVFPCALQRGRVFGAQFHPEKSHRFGLRFFERFCALPW